MKIDSSQSFDQVLQKIRQSRSIACPNSGFTLQLKKAHDTMDESINLANYITRLMLENEVNMDMYSWSHKIDFYFFMKFPY